jgi:uncharacterized protein YndB with AHSA1/START domain
MLNNEWSKFTKRVAIKADIKTLYKAWTTQSGLEHWFLRQADFKKADGTKRPADSFIEKGDTYEWYWHGYEGVEKNTILEVNGVDLIKFGFAGECIVTVKLSEDRGLTLVELTQENIPLEEDPKKNLFVMCGEGWTFHLTDMKSIYEGGLDLRNKDVGRRGVFNS